MNTVHLNTVHEIVEINLHCLLLSFSFYSIFNSDGTLNFPMTKCFLHIYLFFEENVITKKMLITNQNSGKLSALYCTIGFVEEIKKKRVNKQGFCKIIKKLTY